jgi:hypothetical protein
MAADFFLGEYGDTLQVTMPFDATGATVTIEVRKPGAATVAVWSTGITIAPTNVQRQVAPGELDVHGTYRALVVATWSSPSIVRKARFTLRVEDPTKA